MGTGIRDCAQILAQPTNTLLGHDQLDARRRANITNHPNVANVATVVCSNSKTFILHCSYISYMFCIIVYPFA